MNQQQPLLTRKQVEDYLIYHCPLLPATPADTSYFFDKEQLKKYPFLVKFEMPNSDFSACHSTPWKTYADLATMVWRDIRAIHYITQLYYNS